MSFQQSKMANSVQLNSLRRGIGRFFAWWLFELSLLIPEAWRYWYSGRGNILTVAIGAERVAFLRSQPSGLLETGSVSLVGSTDEQKTSVARLLGRVSEGRTHRLYLCLPADRALRRTFHLPMAAEENIRQTLEFELDRQTPFKADQIYFDYRIVERADAEQRLLVELIVLPKPVVEEQIRRAAMLGLPIAAAVLEEDIRRDVEHPPNFLPALLQSQRSRGRLWLNIGFLGAVLVLLFFAVSIPLWHKREQAVALSAMVMGARDAAAQTEKLREQLDELVAEHNFPIDRKNSRVPAVVLVNELSKLLPDDTWVSQFDVNGNDLQIQGETGYSSKLIEVLENSGLLKGANYKSPLTQIPGTSVERFHLSAEIKKFNADHTPGKKAPESASDPAPQKSVTVSATTTGIKK